MLVMVSWYYDEGSPQPDVKFYAGDADSESEAAFRKLIADVREDSNKECKIFEVGEKAVTLYDSTEGKH